MNPLLAPSHIAMGAPSHPRRTQSSVVFLSLLLLVPLGAAAADLPAAVSGETTALTLPECYALALKRSEQIAIQRELIRETEGRFLRALSGALPKVSFELSDKRQDGTNSSAFTLKDIPERKFVFSQPLFSGFKEFAAMTGARAERRQREYDKARAEQLLFVDVSDAFYLLLEQRHDLGALEATRLALTQRIDELKERARLGRSRLSEVASAEAQLRRVEAEIERVRGEERTATQLLEFLTGLPESGPVVDADPAAPGESREETYLARMDQRPDVRSAEQAWRVAAQEAAIARARLWPTVNAEGNYYTKRVGNASGVDWDVLLKVDVPIFQGGEAVGSVREASARARAARLHFERAKREALLEIKEAYARWRAAVTTLDAFDKAREAAEASYRLQVEDYRHSLVNNLEVLQALQALQEARRDVIHADYEAKRRYWSLQVAVGETR